MPFPPLHRDNPPALGALGQLPLIELPQLAFEMLAPQAARPSLAADELAAADMQADTVFVERTDRQLVDKENGPVWHKQPFVCAIEPPLAHGSLTCVNGAAANWNNAP